MSENVINLRLNQYQDTGLYLELNDGKRFELTHKNIERITEEFWNDPTKVPSSVKEAVEIRRCENCGLKGSGTLCDAMRPVIPLLEAIDKYHSYDPVIAVYKTGNSGLFHVSETTMQRALTFVSNISLISYCQVGRKYRKYFSGITPVLDIEGIVDGLYLNIYWMNQGDKKVVDAVIDEFHKEITAASENQLKRLRLISKNDVFTNAFVLSHTLADILNETRDEKLKQSLAQY